MPSVYLSQTTEKDRSSATVAGLPGAGRPSDLSRCAPAGSAKPCVVLTSLINEPPGTNCTVRSCPRLIGGFGASRVRVRRYVPTPAAGLLKSALPTAVQ